MTSQRNFLNAQWRALVMINFEVATEIVQPFVPRGCEIDFHEGRTFASLVGFMFLDTRVMGWKIPFHRNFEEVNLRIYVTRTIDGEVRRGVTFIRELVPRWAIATTAKWLYNEPYTAVSMSHELSGFDADWCSVSDPPRAEYRWNYAGKPYRFAVTASGSMRPLTRGQHDHFIAEHYWGYCAQRDGGTVEYRVEHPAWNVWTAGETIVEGDFAKLYGPEWADVLNVKPYSAFLAQGSEVAVTSAERIG